MSETSVAPFLLNCLYVSFPVQTEDRFVCTGFLVGAPIFRITDNNYDIITNIVSQESMSYKEQ